jgi:hypothetical protein
MVSNCAGGTTSAGTANVAFTTLVTGTREAALAALVGLYPNPAQRTFWLELPATLTRQAVQVTLYNSIGQQVQQRTLPAAANGAKASFEVTNLPHGVYSVHLTTTEGVLIKRLILE